jgi:uncharacterized protein
VRLTHLLVDGGAFEHCVRVDLTLLDSTLVVLCGLGILVGVIGVVVPVLPGLLLCWASVLVWAIFADAGAGKWLVFGIATLLAGGGTIVKYAWPGRKLKRAGVSNWSLIAGGVLGIVGFFVVPVVGLVLGFILGIFLAQWLSLRDFGKAFPSTWHALKAAGLALIIELGAALAIFVAWGIGVATL